MPRPSSASRARRIRRIGLLGLLLTTLLTPAGIIISTVTAAALIGGAFHLSRAEPETADTPPHPVTVKTGSPQHLNIGRDGKTVALFIAEDTPGHGSGVDSFDPANPLFAGLAGNGPTQLGTPGGMPSGRPPGKPLPGGGLPPGATPPTTPSVPPVAGGPHPPPGKEDPDETDTEQGEPEKPDETQPFPPPPVKPQPNPDKQPPEKENGLPPDTLPGLPTLPLADTPLDTQTPPPGEDLATQPNAVPEPSMLGLMLLGVAALAWSGRRRRDSLSPT
jgi:hypothetical protein